MKMTKKALAKIARKAILDATSAKCAECAHHPFEPWYEGYRACCCDVCDDIYEFVGSDSCVSETFVLNMSDKPSLFQQGYRRAYYDVVTACREAYEKLL